MDVQNQDYETIVDRIQCLDCSQTFEIKAGEKRFYESKRLTYPPKRCPQCRKARRLTIDRSGRGVSDAN